MRVSNFLTVLFRSVLIVSAVFQVTACVHVPPTIAHTHVGHAITAFDGTPNEKGLFAVAEDRADDALQHAEVAIRDTNSINDIKTQINAVVTATGVDNFGLKLALDESAKHIEFAGSVEDASANVRSFAPEFRTAVDSVLDRCDLVVLLGNDVAKAASLQEARVLAQQIHKLASVNVYGDGNDPGITQLRKMLDRMVENEDPPYVTVDRWYLFHLVRLPNCENCWAWRKWANSSNRGY